MMLLLIGSGSVQGAKCDGVSILSYLHAHTLLWLGTEKPHNKFIFNKNLCTWQQWSIKELTCVMFCSCTLQMHDLEPETENKTPMHSDAGLS